MIISSQDWCSVQNSVALWLCVFVLILLGWITIYLALRVYSTGKFFHHWIQFSCTHPTFCMLARFHTNGLCLHCVCSSSAVAFSNSGGKTCMIWIGLDFTLCIVIFSDFFLKLVWGYVCECMKGRSHIWNPKGFRACILTANVITVSVINQSGCFSLW